MSGHPDPDDTAAAPTTTDEVDGRTRHYGDFYGVGPVAGAAAEPDDRPVLVVHGNCQAEALRVVLERAAPGLRCVRVPPVHELTAADVPHLQRLLARTDVLVAQPVRDGYRDLPLGTTQVVARTPLAVVVRIPVVRDSRLHPYQALVRVPGAGEPPVVPYHDLRTLALAAGRTSAVHAAGHDGLLEVGRRSQAELRRREAEHRTLVVSDLVEDAGAAASHTLNHPGNPVLVALAQRVLDGIGVAGPADDPGRVLLRSVLAPLHPEVLDALGLDGSAARTHWVVDGEPVEDDHVREAQLAWYREHPDVVGAGLGRHREAMTVLGL